MRVLFAACVWLALAGSALAQQQEPFDFKGVRLGISVDEFRALPAPDGVGRAGERVIVDCTGDEPESSAASCRWAVEPPPPRDAYSAYQQRALAQYGPQTAQIVIGIDPGTASFSFTRDTDGTLRLSEILVGASSDMAPVVVAGLVERFGRAQQQTRGSVVTGLGMTVPQDQMTWRNRVSSIYLQTPAGSLDLMMVVYEHTRLRELARSRETTRNPM